MKIPLSFLLSAGLLAAATPARDLLFSSNRTGNSEIHLLRAGGTESVPLTQDPAGDNWPVWSPDGTRIAFQSLRHGKFDIWIMDADGSNLRRLTDHADHDYLPAWAPDGRRLTFTSWREEPGDPERAPHLYIMNADGSDQRRLVRTSLKTSAGASWSPDGRRIVFSRKVDSGPEAAALFTAAADGSDERPLTGPGDEYHGAPAFSPDGRLIAFYCSKGGTSTLEVIKADGTGRRTVLATGQNWYPQWSADGAWLVFTAQNPAAENPQNIDLYAIRADGSGEPVLLAGGPSRESEGSWRP